VKYLFYSLRPVQCIKNLFIFLPLVFGKKIFLFPNNVKTVFAFFIFSMAAGVVYLVNDIIDIDSDRVHPIKRLRPIASGKITKKQAIYTACILTIVSLGCSFALNTYFGWVIICYLGFNLLYSKFLKKLVIIDVFCVGAFFLIRIIAGSVIAEVRPSYWLVILTVLLALFLAFNKRRQELKMLNRKSSSHRQSLIKYNQYFIDQMISVLTSSIVVVYMLYTIDVRTVKQFGSKHLIYTIPFVYYGIFRYLYFIHRKHTYGDPTRILVSDRVMQINLAIWFFVCVVVIYFGL